MALYPRAPDHYDLKARLKLKDGRVLSSTCSFIVRAIPKLKGLQQLRIKRATQGSHFFWGVDVGLTPIVSKTTTLLFVVRETETGKTEFTFPPERTFRLMECDPKARIETMLYNPFPLSRDPIIEVHALVTEPNKPQRYFVVDLSLGVTLKKKQTLKAGTRYTLHKTKLGDVKLVPRSRK